MLKIALYQKNIWHCYRQWFYSDKNKNSVDMVLVLNGIPLFAFELKNQLTGQDIRNAEYQWSHDRDPRELCFRFNSRILAFFCIDLQRASMTTALKKENTFFLPFNQGSNGAGKDGGAGNPANPNGYMTSYIWENVFQRDSMMDILQKFINLEVTKDKNKEGKTETKKRIIFPRYHQLDVVRKLMADVKQKGAGQNYLIEHSAGSGKSNSIAWVAYRLATIFKEDNEPLFRSVIIVTDRRVLDKQLQETVDGMEHSEGFIETIDEKKNAKDLKNAINDGARIIVTTLQKFPVIYKEVESAHGKNFAIICDEAHSSQTGTAATKLKVALADDEDALKQYAELEEKSEDEIDKEDPILKELLKHGKHKNLSYFAFTATPKLKEVFKGAIPLAEGKGKTDVGQKVGGSPEQEETDPLNEIIKKINDQYGIDLTEADKVIYTSIHDKLIADKKLQKLIKASKDDDEKIFTSSIFPKFFGEAANAGFDEQVEAYNSLFEDKHKYQAMMGVLAAQLFKEIRKQATSE